LANSKVSSIIPFSAREFIAENEKLSALIFPLPLWILAKIDTMRVALGNSASGSQDLHRTGFLSREILSALLGYCFEQ
jgi:hypothetical protein